MPPVIRPPSTDDIAGIVALLMQDARQRSELDPKLWRFDERVPARIEDAFIAHFGAADRPRDLYLVAEQNRQLVGITHSMLVPVPPIYDPGVTPGLLLDDCFISRDAPPGTAEVLLAATEAALQAIGATSFIASSTANAPWQHVCEMHGYEPVTLYLAKHWFAGNPLPPDVRAARAGDVPDIVRLSAAHRRTLHKINSRFWHIHPEADQRFAAWMGYSLTLPDRNMFVAESRNDLAGYIIAQPCPRMHVPLAHDTAGLGVIDDFYSVDYAAVPKATDGTSARHLLSAGETAFAKRSIEAALVVCPVGWTSKRTLLQRHGYKTAKLWMLKKAA
jgi:hypothetical protein